MAQAMTMAWLLLIPVVVYFSLIIRIARSLFKLEIFRAGPGSAQAVSVIIPCRNEEKNLPLILGDIGSQQYPPGNLEVIVVDDNSTDQTGEVATSFRMNARLKVIRNRGMGKKDALRTGIEEATSDLIITTDADCRAGINWIRSVTSFYMETGAGLIIGPVAIESNRGWSSYLQALEFTGIEGITAGTAGMGDPVMCNGANLAFEKSRWLDHFTGIERETPSGDDIFFLHSVKRDRLSDIRFLNSPDAVITTKPSADMKSFILQRARWISKAGKIRDPLTVLLGIVTFVTISDLLALYLLSFYGKEFLTVLASAFILKSAADILIIDKTARNLGRGSFLRGFIPAQLVYPVYVFVVFLASLFRRRGW